jgi:phosphate transport system substrate-binding protein
MTQGQDARRRFVRRAIVVAALAAILSTLVALPAFASSAINGGGSGFAALEIDQWRADTAVSPYNLSVNYVSQGSTFGRQSFIGNNVDFGVSDIIFQPNETQALQQQRCGGRSLASCFVYVPVSAGGVSFMYNLTDSSGRTVNDLRLTRQAACRIFTGAITKWNDPQLVRYNPRLSGVSTEITPFIRADGAGESYVFSEFCIAVDKPDWDAFVADRLQQDPADTQGTPFAQGLPTSNWPGGWGRANAIPFADGVANAVTDPGGGSGSITYVAAGYAKVRNMPVASVQNAAGVFTQPDESNVTVALGYAIGRSDGTFTLRFSGPDPRAYFPSTYSYVLAQTTGFDRGKGEALGKYLCYAVTKGQEIAPQLRYARLSKPLVDLAISTIVRIPGAPSAQDCPVSGAAPPPPPPTIIGGPGAGNGGNGGGTGGGLTGPGVTTPSSGSSGTGPANRAGGSKATSKAIAKVEKALKAIAAEAHASTTTSPAADLERQLKLAAAAQLPKPVRHDRIWLVLIGAVACAGISGMMGVRRKVKA